MDQILLQRVAERADLLTRLVALLERDEHVAAAWLAGSFGRGDADALSDLDVWVVVADEHVPSTAAARGDYAARLAPPVLLLEAPANAPPGGAYLLAMYAGSAGPQIVDWVWQPLSRARLPRGASLLLSRVQLSTEEPARSPTTKERAALLTHRIAFCWMMLAVIAKHIVRRQPWAVIQQLSMVRGTLDGIHHLLNEQPAAGTEFKDRRTDRPPTAPVEQMHAVRALAVELERLSPAVRAFGGEMPDHAIPQVWTYLALAERLLFTLDSPRVV
jgi:predicted nucleotidyltransferase